MNYLRAFSGLALVLMLGACNVDKPPPGALRLDELAGRWVVINYWATWCQPCIREIPELNALHARYPQVEVLGVNYDGATGEKLQQQASDLNINFPLLITDPSAQLAVPRPMVLPTTLILGPDGQLRDTLVGPQTLESLARATSQEL